MASTQHPDQTDPQRASAGLSLNLGSNNPFRNRAASPQSPLSPFDDPPARPVSRNPFLDPNLANKSSASNLKASGNMSTDNKTSASSPTAEELFDSLALDDKPTAPTGPRKDGARMPPPRRGPPGPPGRENMPPPGRRGPPPGPNHRPSRSQEESLRARKPQSGRLGDDNRSPQRRTASGSGQLRRNSDSSALEPEKPLTEEEKKQKELRRRERERRHREHRERKSGSKPGNRKLDIIDQLDATSIYGTGLFHHDGPYDALNPHRNRQGSRRAPMEAYAKDSLNNIIGGSGPLNKRPDHAALMGHHDEEAFKDYSTGVNEGKSRLEPAVFDPTVRGSILHGDQTLGLGTSTFLEGTPAARAAIQKVDEERAQALATDSLQRKKSLAHRIRNINRGPRDFQPSGRMTNPEGVRSPRSPQDYTANSAQSGSYERNPFFNEFDTGKGGEDLISVRKTDGNGNGMTSPGSPKLNFALERRTTAEGAAGGSEEPKQATGLLARVKSLKSGRRGRPAPPPPPTTAAQGAGPAPGTAA